MNFGKKNHFSTKVRKVEKDELNMMMTEMLGKDGEMLVAKPEVKEGKKEAALRLLLVEASRKLLDGLTVSLGVRLQQLLQLLPVIDRAGFSIEMFRKRRVELFLRAEL